MKKFIVGMFLSAVFTSSAFAAVINSEADPVLAGATLVDFESSSTGTWNTQSFGDLTVTAPSAVFSVDGDYAGQYNTRGRLHITNHGSEFQGLRFDVSGGFSALAFLFGASDSSWTLNVYNSGNSLLDSLNIAAVYGSNAGDYFGLTGFGVASYATLIQNQDGAYANGGTDYVFVDNVRFVPTSSEVPEPSSLVLLMMAGLFLFKARQRR